MKAHWMLSCVTSSKMGSGQAMMQSTPLSASWSGDGHLGGGSTKSFTVTLVLGEPHIKLCTVPFANV